MTPGQQAFETKYRIIFPAALDGSPWMHLQDETRSAYEAMAAEQRRAGAVEHLHLLAGKVARRAPICGFCSSDEFQAAAIAEMILAYARSVERDGEVTV